MSILTALAPRSAALITLTLASFAGLLPSARAQTAVATYDLVNVWLLPDITHPWAPAQQMTGTFQWTYTIGDFDNGVGQFQNHQIPWWGGQTVPLIITTETNQIEFTMQGNYHGLGLDVTLRMVPDLSPFLPSPVDTVNSSFDIEVGISHQGHFISGSVVPRCPTPEHYGTGSPGTGAFVPAITWSGGDPHVGNAAFAINGALLLGGTLCATLLSPLQDQQSLFGITALLNPSAIIAYSQISTGASGVAAVGTTHTVVGIPNVPSAIGARFYFQILAFDQGAPAGFLSASDGLAIVICN